MPPWGPDLENKSIKTELLTSILQICFKCRHSTIDFIGFSIFP